MLCIFQANGHDFMVAGEFNKGKTQSKEATKETRSTQYSELLFGNPNGLPETSLKKAPAKVSMCVEVNCPTQHEPQVTS